MTCLFLFNDTATTEIYTLSLHDALPISHPHHDCTNTIAVVHNGIIENATTLKAQLEARGHEFRSETDTEVLAHLIEAEYEDDLEGAVADALRQVEGTYGIAVVSSRDPAIGRAS